MNKVKKFNESVGQSFKFKLPIGDWSDDGHGKCEKFIISSNTDPKELVQMYIDLCKVFPINKFSRGYGEYALTPDQIESVKNFGLDVSKYVGDGGYWIEGCEDVAKMIIDALMKNNPGLKLEMSDEKMIEFNNHFGQFVTKTSGTSVIELPGYGIFD